MDFRSGHCWTIEINGLGRLNRRPAADAYMKASPRVTRLLQAETNILGDLIP